MTTATNGGAERERLAAAWAGEAAWYRWGPYLSARQWGTVREDYSPDGTAWTYFPHDQARSRAYRWSEDGLLGISDDKGLLCFALALLNEADPILKERLFGLTNQEGNHGEDVKEYYYYLDNTPTHSYMKALYKYPQRAYPYDQLIQGNRRSRELPEYELLDTGVFDDDRYFDVQIEYAKAAPDDILVRITATNRGPALAPLHLLPTLWFRNTWAWGREPARPALRLMGPRLVQARHAALGEYWLTCDGAPTLVFTENETNGHRLWGLPAISPFVKDWLDSVVVHGATAPAAPDTGTKVAAWYRLAIPSGASQTVMLRLSAQQPTAPFDSAAALFVTRQAEADAFYQAYGGDQLAADERNVQRQAFAGLLWSKQYYHYNVRQWLEGDPGQPPPPAQRRYGRNCRWDHLDASDVIAMPDTWEYPWFAAWDLAFHCVTLALIDPHFAKEQLSVFGRPWYQHPDGAMPAYEWAFGDVNPPVHAWAAWRTYKIERRITGQADRAFLQRVFLQLLLTFNWWVNRKDPDGRNVFQGGFLGLDNIGVFDRSAPLPTGGFLEQPDGTAWMGMFSLDMLAIALELAREESCFEDLAVKFFEHFVHIAGALNDIGGTGTSLWNEEDGFYYDVLRLPDGTARPLRVRSLVGLIPLLAVATIEPDVVAALPQFRAAMEWFLAERPELACLVADWDRPGAGGRHLLALCTPERVQRVAKHLFDPAEFWSDHGIRSLSRYHLAHPYVFTVNGVDYSVDYEPAESTSGRFGGNSNWRGPVWFPINFLMVEALQRFHHYLGPGVTIECPTGSGNQLTLWEVAAELQRRLISIFLRDSGGRRPVFGPYERLQTDPLWRDYLLFHEYFHGDTGQGLGASHQTGWTALVAKLIEQHAAHPQNE